MWTLYKNMFGKLFAFKYPNQTLEVRSVKKISNVYALSSDRIQYNHAFQTAYGTRCALREDVFEQKINEPQVQFISISLKESWVIWLSVEICFDHARILSMSQPDDAHIRLHSNFIHIKFGMNLNRLFRFSLKNRDRLRVKLELVQSDYPFCYSRDS